MEWRRILPILEASRVMTHADRAALANYCYWWGEWVECSAEASAHKTLTRLNGTIVPNPMVRMARDAALLVAKFGSELGLTPSSRSRIKVEAPDGKDELEKILSAQ